MNFSIRSANEKDVPAIIELMREFAAYEDLLDRFEATEEKLAAVLFGDEAFVECLVAVDGETPIGYALFYMNYASFRGQKGVYLEDIFIKKAYRQSGVGERLIKQVARRGQEKGAVRMDFQVLEWNAPAVEFYKKHGAEIDSDERHFRFTDETFLRLAS